MFETRRSYMSAGIVAVFVATFFAAKSPALGQKIAPAIEPAVEATPMATPRPVPDGRFHVQLRDGSLLVGRIVDSDQLKLKCVVGTIEIPAKKISGIHFEKNLQAKVSFRNHDALSGEIQGTALTLETSFGEVQVQLESIVAVICHEQFTTPGLVSQRVIKKTEDGEVVEWQSYSSTSPYGASAPYGGGYSSPRPASPYYSTPPAVGTPSGSYIPAPTPAPPRTAG